MQKNPPEREDAPGDGGSATPSTTEEEELRGGEEGESCGGPCLPGRLGRSLAEYVGAQLMDRNLTPGQLGEAPAAFRRGDAPLRHRLGSDRGIEGTTDGRRAARLQNRFA